MSRAGMRVAARKAWRAVAAVTLVASLGSLTACDDNGGRGPALIRVSEHGIEFAACPAVDVDRIEVEEDGARTTFIGVGDVTLDLDSPLEVSDPPATIEVRRNRLGLSPGTNIGIDLRDADGGWVVTSIDIPRDGLRSGEWRSWDGYRGGQCVDGRS